MVRVSNYMEGPMNCIARSKHYSVCCLSECELLMAELEDDLVTPNASAGKLLGFIANLSSPTVEAPRELPQDLADKMNIIANRHNGSVPIHGRLFAQWMHFAFPYECP